MKPRSVQEELDLDDSFGGTQANNSSAIEEKISPDVPVEEYVR